MPQHVLIAEDDRGFREMLPEFLREEGYTVHAVVDGKFALDTLRASPEPLVTLLDVNMPRMDGMSVLGHVEADTGLATRHRYILMTASEQALPLAFTVLLSRLGVPVFTKPFDIENILGAVDHATKQLVDIDCREE
jgi:CheY-like chemotaxis protein